MFIRLEFVLDMLTTIDTMIVDTQKDLNVYKYMIQDQKITTCCEVSKPAGLTTESLLERDFNEWAGELRASRFTRMKLIFVMTRFVSDLCNQTLGTYSVCHPRCLNHLQGFMEVTQGLRLQASLSVASSSLVEQKILSITEKVRS